MPSLTLGGKGRSVSEAMGKHRSLPFSRAEGAEYAETAQRGQRPDGERGHRRRLADNAAPTPTDSRLLRRVCGPAPRSPAPAAAKDGRWRGMTDSRNFADADGYGIGLGFESVEGDDANGGTVRRLLQRNIAI